MHTIYIYIYIQRVCTQRATCLIASCWFPSSSLAKVHSTPGCTPLMRAPWMTGCFGMDLGVSENVVYH